MKNLILGALLLLSTIFVGCTKEEITPTQPPVQQSCNCGTITDDDVVFDSNNNIFYTLSIRNDCSGNIGTYYFSQSVWLNSSVGERFCITNVSSWLPVGQTTRVDVKNKQIE
jgi:hypothetical protein